MFENKIEFIAHEDYVDLKQDHPTPIKLNIPKWYKKLEHQIFKKTVKGCMPFLDTLTSGYLLKVAQDYAFKSSKNEKGEGILEWHPANLDGLQFQEKSINLNSSQPSLHSTDQILGSQLVEKNNNGPFIKILNPWIIKTPPGYSCLFLPPMNNSDDRFSIIPGIVDTDSFKQEINFPIVLNGDKYPIIDTIIKRGTPYVQIIPFKRESWSMKIKSVTTNQLKKQKMFYELNIIHNYKNNFWNKKKWN
tara:strand:- start:7975 stop:8715 length:741 start_codon:yes stop_codon:yes gene_type:complete